MATHTVTTAVENLKTILSLTDGTLYNIQNTGDQDVLMLEEPTAPAADLALREWNFIPKRNRFGASAGDYTPKSGEGLFVRTAEGSTTVIVNEAP